MGKRRVQKGRAPGRPSIVERHPEAIKLLLDRVRVGAYLETAASEAGLELPVVREWIRKGNAERLRRRRVDDEREAEELDDLTRTRRMYKEERLRREERDRIDAETRAKTEHWVSFAQDYERALAIGEHALINVISRAAMGGVVISRTTRTDANGNTTTSERFSEPSWNAAAWRLERRAPHRWGSKVEHRVIEDDAVDMAKRGESLRRLATLIERDLASVTPTPTAPTEDPASNVDDGDA